MYKQYCKLKHPIQLLSNTCAKHCNNKNYTSIRVQAHYFMYIVHAHNTSTTTYCDYYKCVHVHMHANYTVDGLQGGRYVHSLASSPPLPLVHVCSSSFSSSCLSVIRLESSLRLQKLHPFHHLHQREGGRRGFHLWYPLHSQKVAHRSTCPSQGWERERDGVNNEGESSVCVCMWHTCTCKIQCNVISIFQSPSPPPLLHTHTQVPFLTLQGRALSSGLWEQLGWGPLQRETWVHLQWPPPCSAASQCTSSATEGQTNIPWWLDDRVYIQCTYIHTIEVHYTCIQV